MSLKSIAGLILVVGSLSLSPLSLAAGFGPVEVDVHAQVAERDGKLTALAGTHFTIQDAVSTVRDPSGLGQSTTFFGKTDKEGEGAVGGLENPYEVNLFFGGRTSYRLNLYEIEGDQGRQDMVAYGAWGVFKKKNPAYDCNAEVQKFFAHKIKIQVEIACTAR